MAGKLIKRAILPFTFICLSLLILCDGTSAFMFDVSSFDASSFETRGAGQRSVTLGLYDGWNFVSIPARLQDASIDAVLKDISSKVIVIWGYDNQNKQWLRYKPGAEHTPNNTL